MSSESNHVLRALRLFWVALGPKRFYVAGTIAILLVLATVGLWHLVASANRSADSPEKAGARISPAVQSAPRAPIAPTSTPAAPQLERAIAITELTEAEERGPRGETFIVAKIGMASRTTEEKDNIEIRVLFFDLDANNEMRPTDARVTYQWITPIRDWTNPEPKYLAATYLQRRTSQRLHYGGFVVRVYCDGKLQDERSKPDALIATLRSNAPAPSVAQTAPRVSPAPAREMSVSPPSVTSTKPLASPTPAAMDTESDPGADKSLPKGIPIPGKPGFLHSPYDPKFIIDVRGFPPGTLVTDPNTNKPFRVP